MAAPRPGGVLQSGLPIAALGLLGAAGIGVLLARDTSLGVSAVVGACYAPLIFISLPLGIASWIPLAFLERFSQVGLGQTLVLVMLGFAWLGSQPAMRARTAAVIRRHAVVFWSLLGLVSWITISLLWAVDVEAAANDFWNWLVVAAILIVVSTTINAERHLILICIGVVAGALTTVVIARCVGATRRLESRWGLSLFPRGVSKPPRSGMPLGRSRCSIHEINSTAASPMDRTLVV